MTHREEILQYIRQNPGITFRRLADELGIGIGNLQYHLHQLEKEGLIFSKKLGGKRYIFPKEFEKKYEPLLIAISNETQRKILLLLAERDMNQREIAKRLKLTQATINYHMNTLSKLGLIEKRKEGRNVVYSLKCDIEVIIRVISEYRPKLWDKLADRLIDLMLTLKGGEVND
ncbi:metalloregulator ArsR/SmtB family transcription factor [Thermococcus sp. M39]|uniref:winged helix-turn-helix transcriptional regulator n=1 Tax=unclassified Thermococcus TaxID=2627626 RepID=UPI00143B5E1D|nr:MULTISPECIES: metalloregulator ArsR/SmtB family transcription factor [unclassified Thermococcus]NJE09047.1 metalloregulator ArsR/SmtB family transcription factor [Thermococcus sp. M39]NJE13288.1 metalloregulator ArsR/SmtB family transcription factor [Thermococcus sp. LS2]